MKKPNILLLMTDQHNAGYLGCAGHPVLRTPHIDALAAESTVFTSAYTPAPICGPARAAILTGRFPLETGVCANWIPVPAGAETAAERLAGTGYTTALFGVIGLTPLANPYGFRIRRLCESVHGIYDPEALVHNDYLPWAAREMGVPPERLAETAGESERYGAGDPRFWLGASWADDARQLTTWIGDEAVSFIRSPGGEKPFFAQVAFFGPHHPYVTCEPWDSMYEPGTMPLPPTLRAAPPPHARGCRFDWPDEFWDRIAAAYGGNISAIDAQIGRVCAALRESGRWDDTLVVFLADHGDHMGDFSMLGKGTMLESSARVPFIVKPPGRPPARARRGEIVNSIDLYRTVLDYANAGRPADGGSSRSLRPLLEETAPPWENATFSSFCPPDLGSGVAMHVRDDMKLVAALKDGRPEMRLYARGMDGGRADEPVPGPVPGGMERRLSEWLAETARAGARNARREERC